MNIAVLYLVLAKAVLLSFNGPSSLPIVREELVVNRRVLTDRELNAAVTAGRSAPGPMGIYVVSVGYFAAGLPGAIAGWLAMITPAFLVIPLIRYAGHRAEKPRIRRTLDAVILASCGLILSSAVPLARDAISGPATAAAAIATAALLVATRIQTLWLIGGAAAIALLAAIAVS